MTELKRIKGVRENKLDLREIAAFINGTSPETILYFGSDSDVYRVDGKEWILFIILIGVHIDGNRGVKLYKQVEWLPNFRGDQKNKMRQRLMNEVYIVTAITGEILDMLWDKHSFSVHLDINSKEDAGSNIVMKEAMGYVKGMLGVWPKVKPEAFFASNAADHFTKI